MTSVYLNLPPTHSSLHDPGHNHQATSSSCSLCAGPTFLSYNTCHENDHDLQVGKLNLSSNVLEGYQVNYYHDQTSSGVGNDDLMKPTRSRTVQIQKYLNSASSSQVNNNIGGTSNNTSNYDTYNSNKIPLKFTPKVLQNQQKQETTDFITNNKINAPRVCSDCNTTTTPLWRRGPRGPKSLCNACGIRQRKARWAMAQAAATMEMTTTAPTTSSKINNATNKVHYKEKKPRTIQCKKVNSAKSIEPQKRFGNNFKNFTLWLGNTASSSSNTFRSVLPQDVKEAAILLMELSCGFIH